jgi:hypothetical protein
MEIYIHTREGGGLKLVDVEPSITVGELIVREGDAECEAWLEDADAPVAATATLSEAGMRHRSHVHIGKCRRVMVKVRYGGDAKERDFAPGATIARVFAWATGPDGFALPDAERPKHTLTVCDTTTEPAPSVHVGSLVRADCALCLDLVPKERFEG